MDSSTINVGPSTAAVTPTPPATTSAASPAPPPTTPATVTAPPASSNRAFTPIASVGLSNIKPLRGPENYETWSCQVSFVLLAIGAKSLILSGIKPDDMTTDRANDLMQQALLIIIQLVTGPILAQIATLRSAHEMWLYLRENYGTRFSFVHQLHKIFTIQRMYDASRPIGDFICAFEQEWARLHPPMSTAASGTSRYRSLMKQLLDQDEVKRDWLLAALASHHPNLVDNMSTEDDLTYLQLKVRLRALLSNVDKPNSAPAARHGHGQSRTNYKKRKYEPPVSPSPSPSDPAYLHSAHMADDTSRTIR